MVRESSLRLDDRGKYLSRARHICYFSHVQCHSESVKLKSQLHLFQARFIAGT